MNQLTNEPMNLEAKRKTLMGTTNNHLSIINNHLAFCPLHLSRTLYKSTLFMQNKPNFRKAETNATYYATKTYTNIPLRSLQKNKPNSNPIQAKTNPKQTQTNPISNPPLTKKPCIFSVVLSLKTPKKRR